VLASPDGLRRLFAAAGFPAVDATAELRDSAGVREARVRG
jgi:hypothetical protein